MSNTKNIEPTTNGKLNLLLINNKFSLISCYYEIIYLADVSSCLCGPSPGFLIPI